MTKTLPAFDQAIRSHDDLLRRRHLDIWVGAEPTFTDRRSEAPEWLYNALGPTKETRACQMLAEYGVQNPGGAVLRTLGRQYPKEDRPRWSLGLYQRRDGCPVWRGPAEPLVNASVEAMATLSQVDEFWSQVAQRLNALGWPALQFAIETPPSLRIVFRRDNLPLSANPEREPRLARSSLHRQPISPQGARDELAEQGAYLLAIDWPCGQASEEASATCIELPACDEVAFFLTLLAVIGEAARAADLPALILTGFPPPVDASIAWTTLTPDPAVIEANLAPTPDLSTFLHQNRRCFAAATTVGLAPYRLHYNGQITDSGGGGQITLGGPSPEHSPFLSYPHLLPALVGYFNRHPSLSYYFAGDSVGNSSQAPRPDERASDIFEELTLTLALLKRQSNPTPQLLWQSLSPFLADPAGNTHRTELNIEKLWNPNRPGGQQGLVEFRAFRMPATPERLASLAALLRAIVAMLIQTPNSPEPTYWGQELHDRFALPYYLRGDLWEILDELASVGLGLGQPLIDQLLEESYFWLGTTSCGPCRLTVRRALEFWPLLGDASSQEHGHSRLVDASTARVEIRLQPCSAAAAQSLANWQMSVNGYRLPLRREEELDGESWLYGVRYRRFKPWNGLHPTLEPQGPLQLMLSNLDQPHALQLTLYEWQPQGGSYDGLPRDMEDAAARRGQRFVVDYRDPTRLPPTLEPPPEALTPYCLDLRWL